MVEDLVISSYKEQIKESLLKAKAIDVAGFSVMIEELKKRGIDTSSVTEFFNEIKNTSSREELDKLTVGELNEVVESINKQVTMALVSPIEISDILVRKSRDIAREMSPDNRVLDDDKFIKVGTNLANEVTKHGIASGIKTCIKNYCIQRLYQSIYKEKIKEKEEELGIIAKEDRVSVIKKSISKNINDRKSKTMNDIFGKSVESSNDGSFNVVKNNYLEHLASVIKDLESYK